MVSFQNPYLLLFLFDCINRFYYKIHRFRGKIIDNTLRRAGKKNSIEGSFSHFWKIQVCVFFNVKMENGYKCSWK